MPDHKQRPGFMLYLDTLCPALSRLTDEQAGALLRGITDYVQQGVIPELDALAGLTFDLLRPGLDRDELQYEKQVIHGKYMAYCRKAKERGETPITEDEYTEQLIVANSDCQLSAVDCQQPTSIPTPTSTLMSTPIPITTTKPSTGIIPDTFSKGIREVVSKGIGEVEEYEGTEGKRENRFSVSQEVSEKQSRLLAQIEELSKRHGGFADL